MLDWLLHLLGINPDVAAATADARLLSARPTILWVGLALAIPLAALIIARHRRSLPHIQTSWRWVLTACRVAVYLLLVFVLAGPYLRIDKKETRKPVLAMIVDESASMDLPAGPFGPPEGDRLALAAGLVGRPATQPASPTPGNAAAPAAAATPAPTAITADVRKALNALTRSQLVKKVIDSHHDDLFKPLADRFDVRVYRVARQVRGGDLLDAPKPLDSGLADETDLSLAIERAIDESSDRVLSGMVVISDGRWTTGADPIQTVKRLAGRQTAEGDPAAPLFAVPPGGAKPSADVAIVDLLAPTHVAKGDKIAIVATVDSQGLDGKTVNVRLLPPDGGKPSEPKPLTLRGSEHQQIQLDYEASEPGAAVLSVRIDDLPEETVRHNNQQSVMIEVDPDRRKILVLEGYARWDFRFLDHSLRRDNGLDTMVVMESQLTATGVAEADLPKAGALPQTVDGWAEYAAVYLGDITPAMLPPRYQEQLAKAVEDKGLGLIVQAGMAAMPHRFADQPLARLLPVKVDRPLRPSAAPAQASSGGGNLVAARAPGTEMEAGIGGLEAPAFSPFKMRVTAAGAYHPALRLYDSATQNRDIWSRMPEFHWSAAVREAGSGATVLAELVLPSANLPLIAERNAGRGRVLFVGTDATYRWRRNIGSHLFYRFWGQAIRHVAMDQSRAGDRSWMEAYPRRLEPGESVSLELYAVDREGIPLDRAAVDLTIIGKDLTDRTTLSRTSEPGHFRGVWQPSSLGQYRLAYTDPRGQTIGTAVEVAGSGRELRRPSIDRDLLGSLADAGGGQLLELDELDRLPKLLKGEPETFTRSVEDEIWDNWLVLVLLVGLYCADVGVRRLLGLT